MDRFRRAGARLPPEPPAPETGDEGSAALRDANGVLARATADEAAAAEARARYRCDRMAPLEQDALIAPLLRPGERLLAVRRAALLDRRQPSPVSAPAGLAGDLYLTSERLVLVGRLVLSFGLDEIEDAVLSGDRLLLVMRDGAGISLAVNRPRLLRVEIATARAAARR